MADDDDESSDCNLYSCRHKVVRSRELLTPRERERERDRVEIDEPIK